MWTPLRRLFSKIGEVQRAALLQIARAGRLDRSGDLVERQIGSGERRGRHHVDPGSLRGQRQRNRARDGRLGLHVDHDGLSSESVSGDLQTVAAVGQVGERIHTLRVGLKVAIASRGAHQLAGRLHGHSGRVLDLEIDLS